VPHTPKKQIIASALVSPEKEFNRRQVRVRARVRVFVVVAAAAAPSDLI